jgi:hypothetical protein
MASWRHRAVSLTIVAMGSMPQYDCDPMAEPATRLEHCIERAVKQLKRQGEIRNTTCDLKLPGRFVIVLHPPGTLGGEELLSAGIPESLLPELRAMRMKGDPGIYVFSIDKSVKGIGANRTVPSSRTNTQSTFLTINELFVVTLNKQPITIDVGKTANSAVVRRIRS